MRRVAPLALLLGALMIAVILLVIVLPAWVRPDWLLPVVIAVIALFVASVFVSAALVRARPQPRAQPMTGRARRGDFALAPRGIVIALALVVYIVAFIAVIVVGQQVIAAHALGANPARAVAITTDDGNCSRCAPDATFAADGHEYRASLSGNIDGGLHPGIALVYDANDPYRVMTLADWQSGRTGSAPYVLLGAPILVVVGTAGLWGAANLRRRRFGALRPGASVESVRSATASGRRRTTRTWQVRFGDGTRTRYIDSPRLRAALTERITTNPGATISSADRALLAPLGYSPSASGYLYGTHEAPPPRRNRTRDRVIMLVSSALVTAGVVTALVVGLHQNSSDGTAAGTVAIGNGDPATDDDCLDGPTLGPSPAATSYLNAVGAAMPEWLRVDASLAAQGGVIHARDIAGELSADTTFVGQLRPIKFPATLTTTGEQLITAVQGYDAVLTSAESHNGYLTAHHDQETQLLQQRSDASGQLRQVLGLPPSHCTLLRP